MKQQIKQGQSAILTMAISVALMACQKSPDPTADTRNATITAASAVHQSPTPQASAIAPASTIAPVSTSGTAKAINWTLVDSGVTPVDKEKFNYPFALDSVQVKAYKDAYQVDAKTARYNLTAGMAVNEVLDKVLDQIGTAYVSHELTAGKDSKFVIHTTQAIVPSEHIYVFKEPFAHGLSMPIAVVNDVKKQQLPHK